jgi:hypothetical protein
LVAWAKFDKAQNLGSSFSLFCAYVSGCFTPVFLILLRHLRLPQSSTRLSRASPNPDTQDARYQPVPHRQGRRPGAKPPRAPDPRTDGRHSPNPENYCGASKLFFPNLLLKSFRRKRASSITSPRSPHTRSNPPSRTHALTHAYPPPSSRNPSRLSASFLFSLSTTTNHRAKTNRRWCASRSAAGTGAWRTSTT